MWMAICAGDVRNLADWLLRIFSAADCRSSELDGVAVEPATPAAAKTTAAAKMSGRFISLPSFGLLAASEATYRLRTTREVRSRSFAPALAPIQCRCYASLVRPSTTPCQGSKSSSTAHYLLAQGHLER